jgi:hypothetical protein
VEIVNEADFHSFVLDRIALEAVLEFVIGFLHLSNFLCFKTKDPISIAAASKHLVQIAFLHLCSGVVFIDKTP